MKNNEVVRVARADTNRGLVLALYPSENKDYFFGEAFSDVNQESTRTRIEISKIQDKIWIRLLDGESHESITADYEAGTFCKKGATIEQVLRSRTFRIAEDSQEAA